MRHYTGDAAPLPRAPERPAGLPREGRLTPLVGCLGEDLDRGGADRLAPCRCRLPRRPGWRRAPQSRSGRSLDPVPFELSRVATTMRQPRVLLAGDAAARPQGLERALTRAGFLLVEARGRVQRSAERRCRARHRADAGDPARAPSPACAGTQALAPSSCSSGRADPEAPAAALALGADDALAAPVHLPELCARLHARIRDRQMPRGLARERRGAPGAGDDLVERES